MIIILIRHAERLVSGADPGLSTAGTRRAGLLATMLAGSGVSCIFTSSARRTKETAAPLAAAVNEPPHTIDVEIAKAKAQILAGGACVVVVGHSDTVPALIATLGGPPDLTIDEHEFDRMFVLNVTQTGETSLLAMRYVSK